MINKPAKKAEKKTESRPSVKIKTSFLTKYKNSFKKKYKKLSKSKDTVQFILFCVLVVTGFMLGLNKDRIISAVKSRFAPIGAQEEISPAQLSKALENKDFKLINVHTPYEGEIKGTDMFMEHDTLKANAKQLPQDKNAKIVLYCKSGNMSSEALRTLKSMGYKNVSHLKGGMDDWQSKGNEVLNLSSIPSQVLPEEGFELPVTWGDLGPKLVELGVIDLDEFEQAMKLTDSQKDILTKNSDEKIKIDSSNGQFVVDALWAIGLAQKSLVYEEGPMGKERKDSVGNFASTGGWTLAKGDAVNYLGKYNLIPLTPEQQNKVAEIAKNVYRPCCGNSTWFPDCNHGMAALAAIEMMVSKGLSNEEIYKNVLKLNSFWFSDHYLTVATYFARQGIAWEKVDAKVVLGQDYSSGQSSQKLYQKVGPLPYGGIKGGSCGA